MDYINVPGKKTRELKLYALSTCAWCEKLKKFLSHIGVEYSYVDLDTVPEEEQDRAVEKLDAIDENWGFPVLMIDEKELIAGLKPDRIMNALGIDSPPGEISRDDMRDEAVDEALARLRRFCESTGDILNPDEKHVKKLIRGLLHNQGRYGYRACPCRLASGVRDQDRDIICPCDYRDADVEEYDACFCALYVSGDVLDGNKAVGPVPERRKHKK